MAAQRIRTSDGKESVLRVSGATFFVGSIVKPRTKNPRASALVEERALSPDERLRKAGLRPTHQRIELYRLLFTRTDWHFSAEELYEEAKLAGAQLSLATIYNTLRHFTQVGLLRMLTIEGTRTYFDTNTSDHYHFFIEDENRIVDIERGMIEISNLPATPADMEIANIDVVIRLRHKSTATP